MSKDFRADGYYDSWSSNLNKASPEKRQGLVHKHRTLYEIIVKKGSEQSTIFINLKRGEGEITRSTSDHADGEFLLPLAPNLIFYAYELTAFH